MRQLRRKPLHKIIVTNRVGKFGFPEQLIIDICRDGNSLLLVTHIFGQVFYSTFKFLFEWEQWLEQLIQFAYQSWSEFQPNQLTDRGIEMANNWKTVTIYEA